MRFNHSVAAQDQAIAADGVQTFDLAVNPLSVILLNIRPLNDTGTLLNFQSYLGLCGAMNRISVLHRGVSVLSMSGRDAAAMAYFRHGINTLQNTHLSTTNFRRCAVLPLILGKFPYDPNSCFPASKRGDLILELDMDIADTGYDGLRISVETVELLEAKPKEFERQVQVQQTFGATGDNDVDLPPGNVNRGFLLFGTTAFTGAAPVPSWGRISVLLDNIQYGFSATDFEVAHTLSALWGRQPPTMDGHIHTLLEVAGGAVVTPTQAEGPSSVGSGGWENYAYLDFDPTRDDKFALDARKATRLHVRGNAETADAVRVIPVEAVPTSQLAV